MASCNTYLGRSVSLLKCTYWRVIRLLSICYHGDALVVFNSYKHIKLGIKQKSAQVVQITSCTGPIPTQRQKRIRKREKLFLMSNLYRPNVETAGSQNVLTSYSKDKIALHPYWALFSKLLAQPTTHTHTHTYIYIYMYIYIELQAHRETSTKVISDRWHGSHMKRKSMRSNDGYAIQRHVG